MTPLIKKLMALQTLGFGLTVGFALFLLGPALEQSHRVVQQLQGMYMGSPRRFDSH